MTQAVTSADMHLRKRTAKTLRPLNHRLCVLVWSILSLAVLYTPAKSAEPNGVQFFREKIEPVLKAQCYGCHSGDADKIQGGLRLDSRAQSTDRLFASGPRDPASWHSATSLAMSPGRPRRHAAARLEHSACAAHPGAILR